MRAYYRNIIFDLDGTLIDSYPGISESLRHAVSTVDSSLDLTNLKNHIGPPLPKMLSRMWPELEEEVRMQVMTEFRVDYNSRGYLFSVAYPGIPEALSRFRTSGRELFVLTNKPENPARKILTHLGLANHFTEIRSLDSVTPHLVTKSEGACLLALKHHLVATETLLVGDSQDDHTAAQSAGFAFLEAAYGYGSFDENISERAWLRLKSPTDLAKVII